MTDAQRDDSHVGLFWTLRFSMLACEGRTAQQMRGDGEADAKYDIRVNCNLCGRRLPY